VDRCDECGFVYELSEAEGAGVRIAADTAAFAGLLGEHGPDVARRRRSDMWSPLEYACHVRDVLLVQRERVLVARREHTPALASMGRDERVDHDGYAEQRPIDVARQLTDAALLFAHVLDRLGPAEWERTVLYNWPVKAERSLRWLAVHTAHELHHHLADAESQLQ
jgi:hypothetical protein